MPLRPIAVLESTERNILEDKAAIKSSKQMGNHDWKGKSERGTQKLGDKAASGNQEQPGREIMEDSNHVQKQNHEGRQAWKTIQYPQSGTQIEK